MDLVIIGIFTFCVLLPALDSHNKPMKWPKALLLLAVPISLTILMIAGKPSFQKFGKLYVMLIITWAVYLDALWRQRASIWPAKFGS